MSPDGSARSFNASSVTSYQFVCGTWGVVGCYEVMISVYSTYPDLVKHPTSACEVYRQPFCLSLYPVLPTVAPHGSTKVDIMGGLL